MVMATAMMIMIMIYANYIHIPYQVLGLLGKCIPQIKKDQKNHLFQESGYIFMGDADSMKDRLLNRRREIN